MTIAKVVSGLIGPRAYAPEGPYGTSGNFPFPSFASGEVAIGEFGAEFEFVYVNVTASTTIRQGDVYVIDNNGFAVGAFRGTDFHALASANAHTGQR